MIVPPNPFKAAIAARRPQIGCWLGFAETATAEAMAQIGYDWLVVDGEHGPNDLRSMRDQLQVLDGAGAHPVLRLPVGETWLIKQALDIGAQTLLIPMVDSAAQAQAVVRAAYYPPRGVRGMGAVLARASRYGAIDGYEATAEREICVVVQVESRAGLADLEAIAASDGVDGVFIGPADLAADMGHPGRPDAPEVVGTITEAIERIAASGCAPGVMATDLDLAQAYAAAGAVFIATDIDVALMTRAASARLTLARAAVAARPLPSSG